MDKHMIKAGNLTLGQLQRNWIFVLCISLGLSAGCGRKDAATQEKKIAEVEVALPMEQDSVITYTSYPSTLQSRSQADVVARVNGQLLKKSFENGQYVNKGQVLFSIEPTLYQSSVNEAKAQVNSALGQLDYAEKHLGALEQAFDANAVSEMDVIQARSSKSQAEAAVNQAKAALTTAATRLGYCSVTAPVSGRITSSTFDVGAYINGDGAPVTLATIYDEKDLEVQFSITDYEYAAISTRADGFRNPVYRNIPVYITSSDTPDVNAPSVKANLTYEAPSVNASSGNILLKAKILGDTEGLRPGMYGRIMLPTGVSKNAILVRDASISTDQRGKYLYVVNDSNKVVYTPIEVGELYNDTLRLVTKGLGPHDRYVTRAMISVRNGETVRPVMTGSKN